MNTLKSPYEIHDIENIPAHVIAYLRSNPTGSDDVARLYGDDVARAAWTTVDSSELAATLEDVKRAVSDLMAGPTGQAIEQARRAEREKDAQLQTALVEFLTLANQFADDHDACDEYEEATAILHRVAPQPDELPSRTTEAQMTVTYEVRNTVEVNRFDFVNRPERINADVYEVDDWEDYSEVDRIIETD